MRVDIQIRTLNQFLVYFFSRERSKITGMPNSYGCCVFESEEGARKAVNDIDGLEICGSKLNVAFSYR